MRSDTKADWNHAYGILIALKSMNLYFPGTTPGDILRIHGIRRKW